MAQTDLRVVKTLRQIDRALLECLASTPFQMITVEQLCRTAIINRSTFYKYYTSKYDLMQRYLQRALDGFRCQVNVAFIHATPDHIQDVIYQKNFENVLRFLYTHQEEYLLLWSIPQEVSVFKQMIDIVHDSILEALRGSGGELVTPYADLYARLFASDMMTLVRWWMQYKDTVSARDVQSLMCDNMKQGIFRTFRERMTLPAGP